MLNFAHYTLCQNKKEKVCWNDLFKQKVDTWHQTLTFLEDTKMLRKYSKISMFNILKTSFSLKMSNAYISNDMTMMLHHIIILPIVKRFL